MRNIENNLELDNPQSASKINASSGHIKASFYKDKKINQHIPTVDINDALRTIICNSKIKIKPYNITVGRGVFDIQLPENIKGSLANLIIVKTLTTIGLRYKCTSCKLEINGNEKTICFHY